MGFSDKHNNANGKDPDFGAIFISNSDTKRESFRRGLFGLLSTEIQFVEKVKAGMIVKFDIIWSCKPIPEKLFPDAIRENYFSANKFIFGLSENQVYNLDIKTKQL
uniref:DCD domain-containing protein n=1 Tax=Cajanus cajan TaxID=3821 RepID=A0A151QSS4_CAJCA|nr:hypothetical protein KK1_045775 [Cajanus cajan]